MPSFFANAIDTHNRWKERLLAAVDGGAIPDRAIATSDNQCELGKWIYGDAQQFSASHEYHYLREKHRLFHERVGWVIELLEKGEKDKAKTELQKGDLAQHSLTVVTAIMILQKVTGNL